MLNVVAGEVGDVECGRVGDVECVVGWAMLNVWWGGRGCAGGGRWEASTKQVPFPAG